MRCLIAGERPSRNSRVSLYGTAGQGTGPSVLRVRDPRALPAGPTRGTDEKWRRRWSDYGPPGTCDRSKGEHP
jgi:hypothetical protein